MEKIFAFVKTQLQIDKITHNLINYCVLFTLAVLTNNYLIGLGGAITFSLLKEFVWDKWLKKGCFEIADLIANGLGILEGSLMYLIYILL